MNSSIVLNEADKLRLESLLNGQMPPPKPTSVQLTALDDILKHARTASRDDLSKRHAGFRDQVTLVSTTDSTDYFKFMIVMPGEADIDRDRISVLMPISLATLGRCFGEIVRWDTASGERKMRIISIKKHQEEGEPSVHPASSPLMVAESR